VTVAIVDCGGANLRSVQRAIELRDQKAIITRNKSDISKASFVILPGVGSAKSVMNSL
jgi:glutamine amidotransferase